MEEARDMFGARLAESRRHCGFTQEELAERVAARLEREDNYFVLMHSR